jgi:hypothetical protein
MASACCVDDDDVVDLVDAADALDVFSLVDFALLDVGVLEDLVDLADALDLLALVDLALLAVDVFEDFADGFVDLVDAERVGMHERCPDTDRANLCSYPDGHVRRRSRRTCGRNITRGVVADRVSIKRELSSRVTEHSV